MPKSLSSAIADISDSPGTRATALFEACDLLAKSATTPQYDEHSENVSMLIALHLKSDEDDIIRLAADMASASETPGTLSVLMSRVEALAETALVRAEDSGEPVEGFLFAVPVVLTDLSKLKGGKIQRNEHFRQLVQELQDCAVVGEGQTVFVENYLYSAAELKSLSWSETWHMAKALLRKRDREATPEEAHADLFQKGQALAGSQPAEESLPALRFLVGIVSNESGAQPPFSAPDEDDELEEWRGILQDWQEVAIPLLEAALGSHFKGENAVIAGIGGYFDALREGQISVRQLHVRLQVAQIEGATGEKAADLRALVAAYVDEESGEQEVVAAIASKNSPDMAGVITCPVLDFECDHVAVEDVADTLANAGLADIGVVDRVLPMNRCEDCGERLLLLPLEGNGQVGLGHAGNKGGRGTWLH